MNCAQQRAPWQECSNLGEFRPLSGDMEPLRIFKPQFQFSYGSKHVYLLTFDGPTRVNLNVPLLPIEYSPRADMDWPRITMAVLVKNKEKVLPHYLRNLEELDYPKQQLCIYIRTNNNTDASATILREWASKNEAQYAAIHMDDTDLPGRLESYADHEWNTERFKALGAIRQASMDWALAQQSAFYWVQDVDNFVKPETLKHMVSLDVPIVAPFMRVAENMNRAYANVHCAVDANGYYAHHPMYDLLFSLRIRGVTQNPVVHCTYLVRADVIPKLTYVDDTPHHEYVVFSKSARLAGVPQYLDTRQQWGWLTFLGEELFAGAPFDFDTIDCLLKVCS